MTVLPTFPTPKKGWLPLILIAVLTIAIFIVSIISLLSGWQTIFQNLFYFPIILACVFYVKRGFVFSVILAWSYFVLMAIFSNDPVVLEGALVRVLIFILVAGVITYLSMIRIRAEEALQFTRHSVDSATETLVTIAKDGHFADVNDAFCRKSGYSRDELLTMTVQDIDPNYNAEIWSAFWNKLKQSGSLTIETTHRTKEGKTYPVETTLTYFEYNGCEYHCGFARDITERKRVEEALRKNAEELNAAYEELTASEEELQHNLDDLTRQELALRTFSAYNRSLLEASLDPLVTINPEGKIADVNLSTEKVTGYSREELIGTDFTNYFTEPEKAKEGYQRVFTDGTVRDYPLSIRNREGHITPVLYNATVYRDEAGNVSGVFAAARDISERKRAEDALIRVNQKLNVLSQLTRKDLYNQIFVLNSYLELAKHQLAGQDHIIETVQKGVRAIQSIHETIEYFKDFQDMGAKPPKWQNVKMALLFGLSHVSIGNIQHSLETKDLEIFADPLLEMVCQRLFENSVKHGDHVTRIQVWHTITPDGATIFFEDDGIGIPQEKKEQIFLRDDGTGRASMRSLIFVREILDITGITICETGEPGKGARFEMTVPNGAFRYPGPDENEEYSPGLIRAVT
jgi:PAS domain S-box-containing protein